MNTSALPMLYKIPKRCGHERCWAFLPPSDGLPPLLPLFRGPLLVCLSVSCVIVGRIPMRAFCALSTLCIAVLILLSSSSLSVDARSHSPLRLLRMKRSSHPLLSSSLRSYPLYKQCDPKWGNDLIVSETVCQVGCLMSSISMALGGFNISITGSTSNPGTLNAWLRGHGGYTQDNDLIESVVPNISPSRITWKGMILSHDGLSPEQIQKLLTDGKTVVIANVRNGRHFVLVTGWQSDSVFTVNDPGFSVDTYNYSDMVGYRLFEMQE